MNQERNHLEFAECRVSRRGISSGHSTTYRFCGARRIASLLLLCVGFFLPAATHANAQIIEALDGRILDTFEPDDYTAGLPATWSVLGAGIAQYDASNGHLLVDRTGGDPPVGNPPVPDDWAVTYVEVTDTMLRDVSMRVEARMRNDDWTGTEPSDLGPGVSLAVRTCFADIPHVCGGDPDNFIYIDLYRNGVAHTSQSTAPGERIKATGILPMEEDVVLQLDAFGEDIKFWVWRPGERRPVEPLIQFTAEDDPTLDPGGVMFGTLHADAWFRYAHVSDAPIIDLPGDFNADWTLTVDDVDQLMTAIRTGESVPLMDLNANDLVDTEDLHIWVKDLRETWFGDANLDGEFNSGDLVAVFEAGKYGAGLQATWAEGDWNADGLFGSGDLVRAFEDGGYKQGPLSAAAAVPEPSGLSLIGVALAGLAYLARRKSAQLLQQPAWR